MAEVGNMKIWLTKIRTTGAELEKGFSTLADNVTVCTILAFVGFLCCLIIPFCFSILGSTLPKFLSPILGSVFLFCCWFAEFRDHSPILRKPPNRRTQYLCSVAGVILNLVISVKFDISNKGLAGFCLTGLAIFCLVMLMQPTYDFGLLPSFSILPVSVLIARKDDRWSYGYIPLGIMGGFFIGCQLYFVKIYDQKYAARVQSAEPGLVSMNTSTIQKDGPEP